MWSLLSNCWSLIVLDSLRNRKWSYTVTRRSKCCQIYFKNNIRIWKFIELSEIEICNVFLTDVSGTQNLQKKIILWELSTFKQTLQWQPRYHRLATASKQSLLGKAYNNPDSDMFSMVPTQDYLRKYIQWGFRVPVQSCVSVQRSRCYNVYYCLEPTTFNSLSWSVYTVQL
jgi:hypothetical protein